ncbi:DUF6892 domain-containing protein [Streptomyces sp. CoH17]|uniref:DUF6892 domain-containing protein n=1 Tax=Streptomyces sp. CoH17 TaxID=2992806 RepID=UPI00226D5DB7|nr:hypothetical protein [Streptomyces sp. CoH17]
MSAKIDPPAGDACAGDACPARRRSAGPRPAGRTGLVTPLASVEELVLDGGLRVYFHCSPVWDGEDDLYDVRSLDDLPLLPHLKRIRGADDFWPPEFLEVLRKRGTATDG